MNWEGSALSETYLHSVSLDRSKCTGCTTCLKRCPTEAIRIRHNSASIIHERCIDCGECIKADDELTHKDAVVTTPLKLFLAKAFSKKTAIIRLNFIDDEKAKLIVDKVKQKLGYPYYITGDKYSPKKLYCTSLLYDAIKEVYPKFSLQYQHINQPIFKGDYLFVEAFFQIKDKTLLYQR